MKTNHRKFSMTLLIFSVLILLASVNALGDNIYVSCWGDGTITKLNSSGNKTTFASGLNSPWGIAFDKSGNLYVADNGVNNNTGTIEKYDHSGNRSTFASDLENSYLWGLAFDKNDNLYSAARHSGIITDTIEKFDPSGNRSTFSSLTAPSYFAFDSSGYLYVSGVAMGFPVLSKIDLSGNVSTFVSDLSDSWGLAFDRDGDLYVANEGTRSIEKYDPSGNRTTFVSGLTNSVSDLAFDNSGNLLALSGDSILKFDSSGNSSVLASDLPPYSWFMAIEPVPEPATLLLLAFGGLFLRKRK